MWHYPFLLEKNKTHETSSFVSSSNAPETSTTGLWISSTTYGTLCKCFVLQHIVCVNMLIVFFIIKQKPQLSIVIHPLWNKKRVWVFHHTIIFTLHVLKQWLDILILTCSFKGKCICSYCACPPVTVGFDSHCWHSVKWVQTGTSHFKKI